MHRALSISGPFARSRPGTKGERESGAIRTEGRESQGIIVLITAIRGGGVRGQV